jgi:hypothetical protein
MMMASIDKFRERGTKIREKIDPANKDVEAAIALAKHKLPSGLKNDQEVIDYLFRENSIFRERFLRREAFVKLEWAFCNKRMPSYMKVAFDLVSNQYRAAESVADHGDSGYFRYRR